MAVSEQAADPAAPTAQLPAPSRRPARWVLAVLIALTLLGGALRAVQAASPDLANLSSDEKGYARVAKTFMAGHFHGTSLHWPPGAPLMFAVANRIHPTPDLRLAYWSQALVGTALIPVVFLLGLFAWGRIVGLVAAGLIAIYPPYVVMGGQLLAEPLGTLFLAAGLAALLAAWRSPDPPETFAPDRRLLVLAGVLLGLTVLTRADLILVPAILAVLTAWFLRRLGRPALVSAVVVLASAVIVTLPWVAVASSQAGHLVPVTEGDGAALFVGTYLPGEGTTLGLKRAVVNETRAKHPRFDHTAPYYIPASVVLADQAKKRPGLDQNASLRAQARDNLRRYAWGQPLRFAEMMWHKASRMWTVSSRAGRAENIGTLTRPLHKVLVVVFVLALLGAWLWRRPPALTALLAVMAYATLLHAVFVSKPRYALPLLPLLVVGGLAALAMVATELARRRSLSQ